MPRGYPNQPKAQPPATAPAWPRPPSPTPNPSIWTTTTTTCNPSYRTTLPGPGPLPGLAPRSTTMATKPNFVSIPLSFYYNGIWQSANWSARVVDDDTGEIVLSAELPSGDDNGPFAALRLTMADVVTLRTLAAFTQSIPVQQSDPSHSSNPSELGDVGRRLAALEAVVSPAIANREWMDEIEKRLAAVEAAAADHRLAEDRWQARQDDQLAELTDRLAALEERLTEIDELATEAREEKATADDTLLTVDIMAVYEMMARREILEATHATPTNPS